MSLTWQERHNFVFCVSDALEAGTGFREAMGRTKLSWPHLIMGTRDSSDLLTLVPPIFRNFPTAACAYDQVHQQRAYAVEKLVPGNLVRTWPQRC